MAQTDIACPLMEPVDGASCLALQGERRCAITARFGAKHSALFGAAARDGLRPESDVDVLVAFDGRATCDGDARLKDCLPQHDSDPGEGWWRGPRPLAEAHSRP